MLDFHLRRGADLTVVAVMVPRVEGSSFAILKVIAASEVENFLEKPADPPGLPGNPDFSLVSMGVYIFNASVLVEEVIKDAKKKTSKHDYGGDIIPQMVGRKKVFAYNFQDPARGAPRAAILSRGWCRVSSTNSPTLPGATRWHSGSSCWASATSSRPAPAAARPTASAA